MPLKCISFGQQAVGILLAGEINNRLLPVLHKLLSWKKLIIIIDNKYHVRSTASINKHDIS